MGIKGSGTRPPVPAIQTPAIYSNVAVQNTWNVVLNTVQNVRIKVIQFSMTVADENLEIRITDSVGAQTIAQTPATAGTIYRVYGITSASSADRYEVANAAFEDAQPFLLEDRTCKVEIRKTSANGANTLNCRVEYAVW